MIINFDQVVKDVTKAIRLIIFYHDCIAWEDYSDRGNACYKPYVFENDIEKRNDALMHAAVKVAMPHGSYLHKVLAEKVAGDLNDTWVTYDWLIKALARLLNGISYTELKSMIELSRRVKNGMKLKGLTKIHSIEEAL